MLDRVLIALVVMAAGFAAYLLYRRFQAVKVSQAFQPNGKPTVLYFRSDTCAPCRAQARFLEQVSRQFGEQVVIEKIDADADRERADRYGVFTVPTTLVIDPHGKVRHANYGLAEPAKLAAQLGNL